MDRSTEILINSTHITRDELGGESFEFVLNDKLEVVECVEVDPIATRNIQPIQDAEKTLDGMLLELNHVRVNPRVDNGYIIDCLTDALKNIGVEVSNPPDADSMAMCFKPLGEISDNVRFYIGSHNKIIFLSPAFKPKLVVDSQTSAQDDSSA